MISWKSLCMKALCSSHLPLCGLRNHWLQFAIRLHDREFYERKYRLYPCWRQRIFLDYTESLICHLQGKGKFFRLLQTSFIGLLSFANFVNELLWRKWSYVQLELLTKWRTNNLETGRCNVGDLHRSGSLSICSNAGN